ncbi:MAG: mannose-6-phosphate isomerase, class I [Chitinophagaceae bacterium]|jgi:mannose-6-phosphate isomerase|nr:mannose-6-phosphate isomerase, class I [Chitinophagaceae bacterium]OQY94440.1 MAG: mannose-6-phosphate isomerase, class I [Sphingobacteriales bacterium UTBCD1]
MKKDKRMFYLEGKPQYFAWGGQVLIPSLIPATKSGNKPIAEYWLGAHPTAPSIVAGNEKFPLDQLIAADTENILGKKVSEKFGRLPYLLKLLDVKDMLSIQVHPSKKEAENEFARENAAGIPIHAPQRNYKDDNHKPELMVALGDFWLLHGFKSNEKLIRTLQAVPELNFFIPLFEQSGYEGLYKRAMTMPQREVNIVLQPLLDRIVPLYHAGRLDKSGEDFWAARASVTFGKGKELIDRGIFSIYFFNLLHLKKGEAIFQDAGVPHAYLEGHNVEIMANSDNVLRGGLTAKHIDVEELLKHVKFQETVAHIQSGKKKNEKEWLFETPAPDFQLSVVHLSKGEAFSLRSSTAEILLLTEGKAVLKEEEESVLLEKGHPSAIIFSGGKVQGTALQDTILFRASVPVHISE